MNQSILFQDDYQFIVDENAVLIKAQQSGLLIECLVDANYLSSLSSDKQTSQDSIQLAIQYRFDIEDSLEELIEEEAFSDDGKIYLGK
ncbi:DUF1488 domain-containing protein [Vibrio sp.]|nr:DUF1488 domain-containing protein [Vibrio sp.]